MKIDSHASDRLDILNLGSQDLVYEVAEKVLDVTVVSHTETYGKVLLIGQLKPETKYELSFYHKSETGDMFNTNIINTVDGSASGSIRQYLDNYRKSNENYEFVSINFTTNSSAVDTWGVWILSRKSDYPNNTGNINILFPRLKEVK